MAKSKEQKQAEAIERKRAFFSTHFDNYIQSQYGTVAYSDLEKRMGTVYAQNRATTTKGTFERYCAEAKIDKHGNPI